MLDLTLDFETYWDTECSIKKLGALEYVRHPKFKVHGAAVKFGDKPAEWFTHAQLQELFGELEWSAFQVISHNANFDLLVLHEIYGVHPGCRVDTLGLCRALLPRGLDFDLDSICRLLKISEGKRGEGAALADVKGVEDPTPEQLNALGFYACGDADDCYGLYEMLWPNFPEQQRAFMNLVLRFSTQGVFERSPEAMQALTDAKTEVLEDRREKLTKIPYSAEQLRSRDQFAQILVDNGITPPMKISPTTKKETYAFSKQDPAYIALQANPKVGDIVRARMAVSSNNAITRIDRIARILDRPPHTLPVQLNVSGAHTHRLSGGAKINTQNLNARGVGAGLREGLRVRDDYVIIVLDQKAIELRMNMWFSGQWNVLDRIRNGGDVYVDEAVAQFNKPHEEVTKPERFYGKVVRLGCQYGMGAPKFQVYVASGPMGMGPRYLTLEQSYDTINTYRANHPEVINTWQWLNELGLHAMADPNSRLERGPLVFGYEQIILPSGLALSYPNLHPAEDGWKFGINGTSNIWGGTLLENICQALTGVLMNDHMVRIDDALDGDTFTRVYQRRQSDDLFTGIEEQLAGKAAVIHTVHDETLAVCRAPDADDVMAVMIEIMTRSPDWAPDLPLEVEGGYAQEYSK